jgi:hypothetical protein
MYIVNKGRKLESDVIRTAYLEKQLCRREYILCQIVYLMYRIMITGREISTSGP